MDLSVFRAFRELALANAGIRIGEEKLALVTARVGKRLRALGLRSERQYLDLLREDESGEELVQFLDVISTNFTSFFREPDHFDRLRELLAERLRAGQRRFRLWSAACSSGEELYTLAMVASDCFAAVPADWRILGTDLSTKVLRVARRGEYPRERLEAVPRALASRYLAKTGRGGPDGELFAVVPELRERVLVGRLNLAEPPFPMSGPLDAVFCRNVMIYLGLEVRQRLVAEIERLLRPGGLLAIGHAETLSGLRTGLRMVVPSVFRKAA